MIGFSHTKIFFEMQLSKVNLTVLGLNLTEKVH